MLAGQIYFKMAIKDIPKKPQCTKKRKEIPQKTIHIKELFITFIIIINLCYKYSPEQCITISQSAPVVYSYGNIFLNQSVYLSLRKESISKEQNKNHIILLLLILANDISPNPGPISSDKSLKCSTCKQQVDTEMKHLKCSTCNKLYHFVCQEIKYLDLIENKGFEWICTSKKCSPNYQKVNIQQISFIGNNRFNLLNEVLQCTFSKSDENHELINEPGEQDMLTISEFENIKMLQELPKISAGDYEGKCLCRICHKEVKAHNRAISCDLCDMWSHLKCSDVSIKLYNNLTFKHYFKWTCTKCRSCEAEITTKFNVKNLSDDSLPDKYESVKQNKNETLILNINCRSLLKKREELEYIIDSLKPNFICLTETWFDGSVSKNDYIPDGYNIIRHDRSAEFKQKYGKNNGGGVAILYRSDIKVQKITSLTDQVEEILWIKVKTKYSFLLGVIYRADYTDILKEDLEESILENNIRRASETAKNVILVGDFNVDYGTSTNRLTEKLENVCTTNGLRQQIVKPTRINPNTLSKTIIDHIWINQEFVPVKQTGTTLGLSDHLATYIKLNTRIEREPKVVTFRNYKKYDKDLFNSALEKSLTESEIDNFIENKDVNGAMEMTISIITDTLNKFAPICETRICPRDFNPVPWFNAELKNIISRKNELLKDFYSFGLENLKKPIKILNNQIVHLKRKLKKQYLKEKLEKAKNNTKEIWKILNSIIGSNGNMENVEPDMMTQEKANDFNNFFATIGEEILKELKLTVPKTVLEGHEGFSFVPETEESICKLIDKMKPDVATGRDGISAKIIKDAKLVIAPIMTKIINLSYSTKIFPDSMKKASIRPLHKKEDPNIISNYRPISILPCLSKVIERSASNQLINYLEKHNLLSYCQHAYRKQHGTQTCLFQVINCVQKYLDQKELVAVVSLDLSKAFDAINHEMLLQKLIRLGLSETSLLWIKSYLSNRKQCTKFSNYCSKDQNITSGVPQGSILGPLLFICFSNDIYDIFENKCDSFSYADDTQLIVHSKTQRQLIKKIEEIIKISHSWYTNNCMKANQGKTEILIVNNGTIKTDNLKIKVHEKGQIKFITPKKYIKVLGILIDENLSWKNQILNVKKIGFNTVRKLHRINHLLPLDMKIQLYNALVVPIFDYADVIWGGCTEKLNHKLQVTQNFAIKSMTGLRKHDHVTESFEKLQFLNLKQRRNVHEVVFAHKSLLDNHPHPICQMFLEQCPTSNTRSSTMANLNYPPHKTQKFEKSPFYRAINSWNDIPTNISTNNSTKNFKKEYQRHLIKTTYSKN